MLHAVWSSSRFCTAVQRHRQGMSGHEAGPSYGVLLTLPANLVIIFTQIFTGIHRPVEEAFDVGYICFIWEGKPGTARTEGLYRIRWLGGPKVPIVGRYPWENPSNEVLSPANRKGLLE